MKTNNPSWAEEQGKNIRSSEYIKQEHLRRMHIRQFVNNELLYGGYSSVGIFWGRGGGG